MNKYAVYHQPESRYAYARSKNELVITLRVAASDKPDKVEILYNNKYDFTKSRSALPMKRWAEDGLFAYYRAEIMLSDVRFAYIFRVEERGKIYYYSEAGLSREYDFAHAYYTFFQYAYINEADVMPLAEWTKSALFYQVFIDRFARGNYAKDDGYINTPWNGDIDRHSFTGGDLDGITEKLDYLCGLGVNALYLTPMFLSDTNHKYNVRDYLTVDPQFGDGAALKRLLEEAHGRGMRIVVDCVFNHCDVNHAFFADVKKNGKASPYYGWFFIEGDRPDYNRGNYAYFADCRYMPKWNTSNAETRAYLIGVALSYLTMGFDGLRLDVADEISHVMWRELRVAVKEKFPQAVILGEIWHDNVHWLGGDQFDGVMNYKLQKILVDYFGHGVVSANEAANRMNALLAANSEQVNAMALNFLDNHDTPRFLHFTGGNRDGLLCALCAAVMFPGMPCVFYGTEIPLDGAGDPDCRKTFDWTAVGADREYAESFKTVLALKRERALTGTRAEISAGSGVLKITRTEAGESVTAYFNARGRARELTAGGEELFSLNCNRGKIYGGGVLVVKNKISNNNSGRKFL